MPRISLLFSILCFLVTLTSCGPEKNDDTSATTSYSPYHPNPQATFAGLESCKSCHQDQYGEWLQSDHHKAMNPATEEFVLGDFDNAEFDHFGQVFRFFRKGRSTWSMRPMRMGCGRT